MILAGDIGGTKTLIGLYERTESIKQPLRQASYPSQRYSSLEDIIAEFLAEGDEAPHAASFAVAGPVVRGRSEITNLPWIIAADTISETFKIPQVHLMNDVEATAAAVPALDEHDVAVLREDVRDPTGAIGIIAPGTGLGESFLTWNGTRYQAYPSEGGHASFAPSSPIEVDMLAYLYPRYGHLSFERVCSGSAIAGLYEFLRLRGDYEEEEWLRRELAEVDDPNPVIVGAALEKRSNLCVATLDLFVRILAGEMGNMALKVLATGGIYLGGGIPPRILPRLQQPDFLAAMSQKGRFNSFLNKIPVYVIVDREVNLHGAAYDGFMQLEYGIP
ncbi:MAG: glucokinase [Caldilineaceae bacterium]|nr:glucokinase [Caldilineaceae bacterium]MCB9138263.1 glucokinase [Caldilineaceae bacterium]